MNPVLHFRQRELGFTGHKLRIGRSPIDSSATLKNLRCLENDNVFIDEESNEIAIYDAKFCPAHFHPNMLAVVDEDGCCSIVDTGLFCKDRIRLKEQCHDNALHTMDWSSLTNGVLATCSADKTVKVWDLKEEFANVATFKEHTGSVRSVKFHPSLPDFLVSCSTDGTIRLWDSRQENRATNVIADCHGERMGVADVFFYDENTIISASARDSNIRLWDIRKTYTAGKKKFCKLVIPTETKGLNTLHVDYFGNVYASTRAKILKFNVASYESEDKTAAYFIPPDTLNNEARLRTSRDGRFLASGSTINEVYIWDMCAPDYKPYLVLTTGTGQRASSIGEFSPIDSEKICTTSDEGSVQIWTAQTSRAIELEATSKTSQKFLYTANALTERHSELLKDVDIDQSLSFSKSFEMKLRFKNQFPETNVPAPSSITYTSLPSIRHDKERMAKLLKDMPNFVIDGEHWCLPLKNKQPKKLTWLEKLVPKVSNCSSPNPAKPEKRVLEPSPINTMSPEVTKKAKRVKIDSENPDPKSPFSPAIRTPRSRKSSISKPTGLTTPSSTIKTPTSRRSTPRRFKSTLMSDTCPSPKILQFFAVVAHPGDTGQKPM